MNVDSFNREPSMLNLSMRETRMIIERILLVAGIPQGFLGAVRDCVLYSQACGLGGLQTLKRDFDLLARAKPSSLSLHEDARGRTVLDCHRQHSWIVAPAALDLALAAFRTGEGVSLLIRAGEAPEEFLVIEALAGRHGARIEINQERHSLDFEVCVLADGIEGEDSILKAALSQGLPVPRALWHELYEWSHQALSPDSITSRRHAGPVMVDADGRVHGRDDDDTDFALLLAPAGKSERIQEKQ